MQFSAEKIERFYGIWLPLLHFVNEQQHLVTSFPPDPREARLPLDDVLKLREAL